MKKILTVSLVAMMAVSAAHADLASTAYVDTVAAAEASAAQTEAIKAAKTETESQISAFTTTHSAVLNSTIDSTKVAQIATNAENIAKNAQAITEGDNAVKAIIGDVTAGKTVAQMIEDAQSAATYNDTEVRGLISDNANAIDAIEKSAYATSGITSGLVGKISTNESAITTLNAGAQTAGSVDYKVNAAKTELQSAIDGKAAQADLTALQNTVNDTTSGLAATKGIADQNKTDIATINNSAVMKSGITSELVGKISTNESAITTLNANAQTAGSVDNKIAAATANMATDGELESGLATKQNTLTATETIGIAANGAISVKNASIGKTQLADTVNASLALADTSFQTSAVLAAEAGGDGEYALTMKTVGGQIQYVWNKISYTVAE
ncbi:MAG: hypothetical protein IKB10_01555 [Alphaproteobacteria bacterium]|nr:hypothetical protein [Alphaproteobacteria bacterium]